MKRLPRPKDQQYVSLYDRVREGEEKSGDDRQEYRKVDVSRLVPAYDFGEVFIDVEKDRGRNVRRAEKQKSSSHSSEAEGRAFDPRAQQEKRHRHPRAQQQPNEKNRLFMNEESHRGGNITACEVEAL